MNIPNTRIRPRHGLHIHGTIARFGMALIALSLALVPVSATLAVGPIWLPTVQATQTSFDNIHPVMATYHNHAFILTTRDVGAEPEEQVYFTTNASGAWTTRLLSAHGPGSAYGAQWTALTIDPSINRLYAAWVRPPTTALGPSSLWVWTSDDAGSTWHGPTTIAQGQFSEPPDIVAAHGKAYVAFSAAPDKHTAPCNDTTSRTADVMLTTFAGGHWSAPRNLTSCVAGAQALSFDGPKLALDETSGHLYLVSDSQESNLWYMDNAAGSWSTPHRIVTAMDDLGQSYGGYRYDYRIAIAAGTVYVAYDDRAPGHAATPYGYHDVFLAIHPLGGSWTLQRVTQDPNNCVKAQVSLVTRAGRLGLAFITFGGASCAGSSARRTPYPRSGRAHPGTGGPAPSRRRPATTAPARRSPATATSSAWWSSVAVPAAMPMHMATCTTHPNSSTWWGQLSHSSPSLPWPHRPPSRCAGARKTRRLVPAWPTMSSRSATTVAPSRRLWPRRARASWSTRTSWQVTAIRSAYVAGPRQQLGWVGLREHPGTMTRW